MIKLGYGVITGTNVISVGISSAYTSTGVEAAEEGSYIVNEDGSGDKILFENDDSWVSE